VRANHRFDGTAEKLRFSIPVCHCERKGGDVIRIISARKATKQERSFKIKGGQARFFRIFPY